MKTARAIPVYALLALGLAALLAGVAAPVLLIIGRGQSIMGAPAALELDQPLRPELIVVPPGTFRMGSPDDEPGRSDNETPHRVRVGEPGARTFAIGRTEVTQAQWRAVMGGDPSYFRGPDRPVERVSWAAALLYLNRLSAREGLTACYRLDGCRGDPNDGGAELFEREGGYTCAEVERAPDCAGYRLPSEAEWEYAARAGTSTAIYTGPIELRGQNDAPALDPIAWYSGNSGDLTQGYDCAGWPEKQYPDRVRCGTHPVSAGTPDGKAPNAWKLYDMLGNVWEWTEDAYVEDISDRSDDTPLAQKDPRDRVFRGCGWHGFARGCRAAARGARPPGSRIGFVGLRPARTWTLAP